MILLVLSRDDFLTALTGQDASEGVRLSNSPVSGKLHWTRRERFEVLSRVSLFSHLDSPEIAELAECAVVQNWPAGAMVIRRGDEGDRFYVVLDGTASVRIDDSEVGRLQAGDQFGEIALLHDVLRSADVIATAPLVTLSLERTDFLPAARREIILG